MNFFKWVLYQVTLGFGYIRNKIWPARWPAYNQITDSLYLGRLPLKNSNDHLRLKDEGIGAVLAVIESFENHSKGLFTDPVTPEDWQALNVAFMQIETADFRPLSVLHLKQAVAFIDSQIAQGKKVYVHCKAGRGRSAAVVVAYLAKNFSSVEECIDFVHSKRPLIILKPDKIEPIRALFS